MSRVGSVQAVARVGAAPIEDHTLVFSAAQVQVCVSLPAVAVAVTVAEDVRLDHVWSASDAGLVINPDGARNQLEGGIVQAASFALKEAVKIEGDGIASRDWESYPVLRFSEVPPVDVDLIGASDNPSLGVGECTVGPTCAAIGNAVAHALGRRIYDMPLNRERIMSTLLAS